MDEELELSKVWSIGEQAFAAICEDARGLTPRVIVEFGSGPSTIRIAQAFPAAHVHAIDNWPPQVERVQQLARKYDVAPRIDVSLRPLSWQRHGAAVYQSYTPGPFPHDFDFAIIDGPPKALTRRGREACLYQALAALRVGGRIYLDDYRRRGERATVRNWLKAYPGVFKTWVIPFDHQIFVLEKLAPASEPKIRASITLDVAFANIERGAEWTLERIKSARAPRG